AYFLYRGKDAFRIADTTPAAASALGNVEQVADSLFSEYLLPFEIAAALLLIGTVGVLTRRNVVIILMSIELILNAVNINLVAFSHALKNINGQIFAIFVITDAVAEAAVGLGILIALFRNKETVLAD